MVDVTSSAPSTRKRGRETVADMGRSMALVGAVVLALFLVVWWQRPEGGAGSSPRVVDVPGVVAAVGIGDVLPAWQPEGLSSQWRPTAAWFAAAGESGAPSSGGLLLIGYQTPAGSYAEVRQTDAPAADVLADWTDDGQPVGQVEAGGRAWQHYQSADSGRQALVTTRSVADRRIVVVVTGKPGVGLDELTELAASLRPPASTAAPAG
jgi:hypothetical protein